MNSISGKKIAMDIFSVTADTTSPYYQEDGEEEDAGSFTSSTAKNGEPNEIEVGPPTEAKNETETGNKGGSKCPVVDLSGMNATQEEKIDLAQAKEDTSLGFSKKDAAETVKSRRQIARIIKE